ncbi:fumarylacetoacetase [Noviherbaspirillum galbum]|uniref:fumarylacetoacetase n=1 Tax=Noviherbaspirillum galbum TaxID=2709383 RepID=A0A6B3SQN3_9BURK|nr:fumarylacetoacetase [Noviherbaspirillum galbum]NEX63077.1 fumarylacetoacetase [Noviherbaspirillum galbum]
MDKTHDPALTSWVASANDPATDFPIQNLPYGRFRLQGDGAWRVGVAIGDQVLDLSAARFDALGGQPCASMESLMAATPAQRRALRAELSEALRDGSKRAGELRGALHAQAAVELGLPCRIGDYTDFYTGIHHATTVGKLFRPDNPLLPNYKWVPIGYHGRVSSIGISGQQFHRPRGQLKAPDQETPSLQPSKRLDYELELGIFVCASNALGEPVAMEQAEDHIFGLTLLNDWSARDVQAWEYQPLGPFLSKSFATTLSPWVVTLDALAPYRKPFRRPEGDPQPLPYLDSPFNRECGAIDMVLEVWLQTPAMRQAGQGPQKLMSSNFTDAYWTVAQLVAHHTVNGCNLQPGDLLGSGTISGPQAGQGGSLLELSSGGKTPLVLANGERRTFLEDGDTVSLRAYCQGEGLRRIGLGECVGTVLPART